MSVNIKIFTDDVDTVRKLFRVAQLAHYLEVPFRVDNEFESGVRFLALITYIDLVKIYNSGFALTETGLSTAKKVVNSEALSSNNAEEIKTMMKEFNEPFILIAHEDRISMSIEQDENKV